MPIHYNINSQLNMLIFVCTGSVTAAEFFQTADMVYSDARRKTGLITIVDLFSAVENFHLKDIYDAIKRIEKSAERGFGAGPMVLLSRSTGIHVLADTFQLLPSKAGFKMKAFHTMEDAIKWLGCSEFKQEIMEFWQDTNSLVKTDC